MEIMRTAEEFPYADGGRTPPCAIWIAAPLYVAALKGSTLPSTAGYVAHTMLKCPNTRCHAISGVFVAESLNDGHVNGVRFLPAGSR